MRTIYHVLQALGLFHEYLHIYFIFLFYIPGFQGLAWRRFNKQVAGDVVRIISRSNHMPRV
jgi:hypothetical protein